MPNSQRLEILIALREAIPEMTQGKAARLCGLEGLEIPDHISGVAIDACVVMPTHTHGILVIEPRPASALDEELLSDSQIQSRVMSALSPKAGSLGAIIRSYKSAVTNWAGLNGIRDFAWQPRYWDHVIRDERSLQEIQQYIHDNPARWELERQNLPALRM